jgi:hypothetical protein
VIHSMAEICNWKLWTVHLGFLGRKVFAEMGWGFRKRLADLSGLYEVRLALDSKGFSSAISAVEIE